MLTFLCLAIALAQPPQASQPVTAAKPKVATKTIAAVAAALPKTKFKFTKADERVWLVSVELEQVGTVEVAVRASTNLVVLEALVQEKPPLTLVSMRDLLTLSYNANFAKLALDENGDLVAMTELAPDFSVPALKTAVEEVARLAADAVDAVADGDAAPAEELPEVAAGSGATLPVLRGAFELNYDPAKWKPSKADEPGVVQMVHKSGEAYVKIIADRNEITPEGLRGVVLENARSASPDVTLSHETPRTINGLPVRVMRYGGESKGFKFTFYNQIFADASGNVQLAAWTGSNLFEEYRREFLELFAGFRKVQK